MGSVEKTIQILNCLSKANRNLGVTEISSQLSIPKSTVHRILSSLLCYSLVSKDNETSRYRLGIQVLRYSNSFYNSYDFRQTAKKILKRLCEETGLTTYLSIWQNDNVICIDSVNSSSNPDTHQLFVEVGKIMPFHCAASAKILLAYQPSDAISLLINQATLQKYTSKTIINYDRIVDHLEKIKIHGYAICDEELEEGIRAVSAPIKNINGKILASITITGLVNRIPATRDNYFIKIIVDAAKEISNLIGYEE
jgi:IclR family transcriptional regulator, KDG regulon repressor